jgi:Domain of unknown function (DUF4381)
MPEDPGSLENLQDVVLPVAVSWWPPAPGWYLLATVVLGLLGWLATRAWRTYRRDAYRRTALAELRRLRARLGQQPQRSSLAGDLGALLRRTALARAPRETVAGLSGSAWQEFLNHALPASQHTCWDWLELAYRPEVDVSEADAENWIRATDRWIRRHRIEALC